MRAGTSMPGFSLVGISHTQSPTGSVFIGSVSDVDDESRAPTVLPPLQRELVERHRLGIGSERGDGAVDRAAGEPRPEPARRAVGHVDLHDWKHEMLAVLHVDQLGKPVVEQQVERGSRELETALDGRPDRGRVHHDLGQRPRGRREEIVEVVPLDLHGAVGDRDRLEDLVPAHDPLPGLYSAFTGIGVPFAAGVLGSLTVSTPSLNVAFTFSVSTPTGRAIVRANAPHERSTRWYFSSFSSFALCFSPLMVSI